MLSKLENDSDDVSWVDELEMGEGKDEVDPKLLIGLMVVVVVVVVKGKDSDVLLVRGKEQRKKSWLPFSGNCFKL